MFYYMSYLCVCFNLVYFTVGFLKLQFPKNQVLASLFQPVFVITHTTDWLVSILYWVFVHHDVVEMLTDPWSHILTSVIGHVINLAIPLYDLELDTSMRLSHIDLIWYQMIN